MKAEKLGKQFHFDNEFWDEPLSCGWIDLYQLGEISCEHGFEIEEHEQFVHEVTYIISGSGEASVDGKKIPLREGDVLMCSMGHQHAIRAAERDILRFAYIGFRFNESSDLNDLAILKACYELPYILVKDRHDVMDPFLRAINELYSKTLLWYQMLQSYCEQIVIQAVRDSKVIRKSWPERKSESRSVSTEVYKIIQYVGENVEQITSVRQIADTLCYNYTYLSHFFARVTGITLQKYISQKKIERARQLLKYQEFSVTEIAERLNYESVQSFSKAFRRVMGVSPTAYLQRERHYMEAYGEETAQRRESQ